ncbi:MAG: hypothetical protein ACRDZ8_01565 [Acidimicrobiales bacterium]
MVKGKWAKGIPPRFFAWIIKDKLAVSERPGGYARNHRRVRRQEEILWLRGEGFTRVVSLLPSPHNLYAYDELDLAWAHIPFGAHDDPEQVLPDIYGQWREWMAKGERLLVHQEELNDRLMGVLCGYLRWSGLVPAGPQAITVVERILQRQMGPAGRELVAMAPKLAGAGGSPMPAGVRTRATVSVPRPSRAVVGSRSHGGGAGSAVSGSSAGTTGGSGAATTGGWSTVGSTAADSGATTGGTGPGASESTAADSGSATGGPGLGARGSTTGGPGPGASGSPDGASADAASNGSDAGTTNAGDTDVPPEEPAGVEPPASDVAHVPDRGDDEQGAVAMPTAGGVVAGTDHDGAPDPQLPPAPDSPPPPPAPDPLPPAPDSLGAGFASPVGVSAGKPVAVADEPPPG